MNKVPYALAIGSLIYAMLCTRLDIAYAVRVVSKYMSNLDKTHYEAMKWIMRYLRGTSNTCLCFGTSDLKLEGFVDANLVGDIYSRKNTTSFVFILGCTVMSWDSNLQKVVALSTTKAEYVAMIEEAKEMIWLQTFMKELGQKCDMGTLYSDSQNGIFLAKNPVFHSRTKHIQVKCHFIQHLLSDEQLKLEKICESQNPTNMLTKDVTVEKLRLCTTSIGLLA